MAPKRYDREYFDRWYRDPRHAVKSPLVLERKVRMVVATAEYYLGRPIESVLDVGAGEGAWLAPLRALRPRVRYLGLDSSEYAIARHGTARNLRLLGFADLEHQRFDAPVDLLVCSDVLHYVPTVELKRGVAGFEYLCTGLAFLELFCRGDDFVGDHDGYVSRPAAWYRKVFAAAGFSACGSHCYLSRALRAEASALELCSA
ncbi:MAG TPA: class I SAM-dependent methyltransferase [Candidatus Saccharimonadia bacterium]|nr:class I SAM-dependent methyltransferase [Candidatus Saccharimonadia bacterium]